MEVGVLILGQVLLGHGAHAERGDPLALGHRVRHLQDHHVAAIAVATLDVAAGRRTVLHGRHDLEEVVAGRADDVGQAPLGDAGIAIGDLDAENVAQLLGGALKVFADEDALPQSHRFAPIPLLQGLS